MSLFCLEISTQCDVAFLRATNSYMDFKFVQILQAKCDFKQD